MAAANKKTNTAQAVNTTPAQEPEINEVDGEPKLTSCTLEQLAEIFLEEGKAEGVRGDVAFAQSLHETGYFKFGGIVLPSQNNYAGIGALNGKAT